METVINEILPALINLAIAGIAAVLIPLIITQWQRIKGQLTEQQLYLLMYVAGVAVQAAEQKGLKGETAKNWAVRHAEALAAKHGVRVELDDIGDIIEAAVYDQINRYKPILLDDGGINYE